MMDELKDVKRALNPTEVLLVVDAMTGQEAAGIHIFRFNCLRMTCSRPQNPSLSRRIMFFFFFSCVIQPQFGCSCAYKFV